MFHGFDYRRISSDDPTERLGVLACDDEFHPRDG